MKTTVAELLPCSRALAALGDRDDLSLALHVRISRLQVAVSEWVDPHVQQWNRLVAECGSDGQVEPRLENGEPNPHWERWVTESASMKAEGVTLDVEPLTVADLEGLDPPPKSSVLTPLLRVGLLTDEEAA